MRGPEGPLSGRRVLVTRGAGQSAGLADLLRARGAEAVEVPTVETAPPEDEGPLRDALRSLTEYDWLLLTSANAVRALARAPGLARVPPGLRIGSAGPATTEAVERVLGAGVTVEAACSFGAEGLAMALSAIDVAGSRMLFPVSDRSPAALADTLRARGANVEVVIAYRTTVPEGAGERIRAAFDAGIDAVTFASPSAVEAFALLGGAGCRVPAVVIGPSTASAARAAGFTVAATAETATGEALAAAVERYLSGPRSPQGGTRTRSFPGGTSGKP